MTSTGKHDRGHRIGTRPTKAEIEVKVTEIFKLLIAGVQRHDIRRYVAEKVKWEVPERTLDRYLSRATELIRASAAFDRNTELGRAISRLHDLYSRSYRVQDFKTCLTIQRELNELLGLYAPKRMEVTGADGSPPSFIAIMPAPAQDNETWSRQCRQEREQLEHQRAIASTPEACQQLHIDVAKRRVS